jgi:hypothetical protein
MPAFCSEGQFMTDLLTRLAELTRKDDNGLLPCNHCQISQCSAYENDYGRWLVGCGACGSHTGTCKTKEDAVQLHNGRPREAALIALVQEAAGEIERLRKAAQNLIDTFKIGDGIVKDGVPRFVANAIAVTALHELNQALNPQEEV